MEWWVWVVVGCLLLAIEVTAAGNFYIFFFGVGAIITGILAGLGFAGPAITEWIIFSLVSIAALITLRRRLLQLFRPSERPIDSMIGETAKALEEIKVGKTGKVELRGSTWNAQNIGADTVAPGQRCKVDRLDGLTLIVRAD